jgi:hypothetical protein
VQTPSAAVIISSLAVAIAIVLIALWVTSRRASARTPAGIVKRLLQAPVVSTGSPLATLVLLGTRPNRSGRGIQSLDQELLHTRLMRTRWSISSFGQRPVMSNVTLDQCQNDYATVRQHTDASTGFFV